MVFTLQCTLLFGKTLPCFQRPTHHGMVIIIMHSFLFQSFSTAAASMASDNAFQVLQIRHLKSTFFCLHFQNNRDSSYHLNYQKLQHHSFSSWKIVTITIIFIITCIIVLSLNGWVEDKSKRHYLSSKLACLCCTQHRYGKVQITYIEKK